MEGYFPWRLKRALFDALEHAERHGAKAPYAHVLGYIVGKAAFSDDEFAQWRGRIRGLVIKSEEGGVS